MISNSSGPIRAIQKLKAPEHLPGAKHQDELLCEWQMVLLWDTGVSVSLPGFKSWLYCLPLSDGGHVVQPWCAAVSFSAQSLSLSLYVCARIRSNYLVELSWGLNKINTWNTQKSDHGAINTKYFSTSFPRCYEGRKNQCCDSRVVDEVETWVVMPDLQSGIP